MRCAIVGLGDFGSLHAAVLAQHPLAELTVCCDREPALAARVPAGTRFVTDLDEALTADGLEAVWCCTPPSTHRQVVSAALDRGLDVFCEKPLATTLTDVDALLYHARTAAGRLAVGHLYRFDPRFAELAAATAPDGPIGPPIDLSAVLHTPRADARRLGDDVSVTLENSIHLIDAFLWLAGPVTQVYATATGDGGSVASTLRFATGAVGSLMSSWTLADDAGIDWQFQMTCNGEHGFAAIDGRDRGLAFHSSIAEVLYPNPHSWPRLYDRVRGMIFAEVDTFLLGARDAEVRWPLSLDDARNAIAAALAIDESARAGQPVALDP